MTAPKQQPPLRPRSHDQSPFTVLVPIAPGHIDAVRAILEEIGSDLEENGYIRFSELTGVHYCRFVIVPADPSVNAPASVAFASNHDGSLDDHLDELVAVGHRALDAIYRHCIGWPTGTVSPAAMKDYLRKHAKTTTACYVAHRGLSQRWIQNDMAVREAIRRFLRDGQRLADWPPAPSEIRARLRRHLVAIPGLSTRAFDRQLPSWKDLVPWLVPVAIALPVAVPIIVPLLLGPGVVLVIVFRQREKRESGDPRANSFPIDNLLNLEDRILQNQLTHLVTIKPGRLRSIILWVTLKVIHNLAHYWYTRGELGGISTIHFARWVIIDDSRRLLFFSNYDSNWESYLGEFIDKASSGLTAIWSNTEGFPQAKWLLLEGARHAEKFKQWVRAHQLPTQVWYSAYPDASVSNVINNADVRNGVEGDLSREEVEAWLSKL